MEPHRYTWLPLAFALTACAALTGSHRSTPLVTYHQHLVSPATAALWEEKVFDATDLITQLDAAGIERAVVLSVAYLYGDERRQFENEYARVRAENDWTEQQVARYPERLIGFCGVSPLRDYALEELRRCSTLPHMKGLKLHLGNSGVNLRDAEHRRRVAKIFAVANERRLPIVIHMRTRVAWPYGREDA